ncbi:molybdopterin molybdotransferase MoeA [Lutimaribacter sp. EGI FJ00015]|uniref:Molybdopterin molybdotransferase MoeA n=1 Tax=Lutimaribacter degradans TaxID=2945989 RepID=A0ACC5ZX41_9RHOB|nr:gephyrin-like molybdotransferase Glp [Lutimaribacter sp. EGI FJ00013]MCM2562134.1 molybdopterin molybdotransferase MoeA [Lutimaribacter sp. EGI FJ00013]MCO0613287.1 molybdopterin molybdotransferase MoeA [Lutimaribacter sp. EGI FJ00015]MCO0636264.1 molybdopterin molybdotransferase MoeA [Lutimaribacter sp. EGI FJ00014]
MITVNEALDHLFALAPAPVAETVPLLRSRGRVMVADAVANRSQPPFAASAMDGYGIAAGAAQQGAAFDVIGEAAAGHGFAGTVGPGQAVRIFTGAPVPEGVGHVVLQEDCTAVDSRVSITGTPGDGTNIRPAGGDFREGDRLSAPRRLTPADMALLASMNVAEVPVARRPVVALISTGDELVMPGETPGPDQIIASNTFGLHALVEEAGAEARLLPIARDIPASLRTALDLAKDADVIVTIGGASVGDHDIVARVAEEVGMERAFYKIAMRPGKPLMAGRLNDAVMIGLPGNPVSAMVCGHLFLLPVLRAMMGLHAGPAPRATAQLGADVDANGPREHYMRARLTDGMITPFARQDSSLLSILSEANALLIRPIGDGPRKAGEPVEYVPLFTRS